MSQQYRKKPVVIEAVLLENSYDSVYWAYEFVHNVGMESCSSLANKVVNEILSNEGMVIKTLEGDMLASFGDYIIKGVNGEFYPCKPDIFHKTYDKVN